MRRPSYRVRPTLVTTLKHTWGKDADGGRVVASTVTTTNVLCSIEPGSPSTSVDETGRWTTEDHYTLRFSSDPGLNAHDEITWSETQSSRVHHLVALGTANRMGRGATFEVPCAERI